MLTVLANAIILPKVMPNYTKHFFETSNNNVLNYFTAFIWP